MSTLKPQNTRALARGAIIAALYTALTVLLAPLSYGEVRSASPKRSPCCRF